MFPSLCYFVAFDDSTVDKSRAMTMMWIIQLFLFFVCLARSLTLAGVSFIYVIYFCVYVCVLLVMLYLSVEFCHLTLFNSQREKLMWNSAFVGDRDGIFVFCSTTENFLQLWQPLFFFLHDSLYVHQAYEAYAFRLFTIDTKM